MKKIIAAIDALNFTEEQLDTFQYIAREAKGQLTVVSLEDIAQNSVSAAATLPEHGFLNYGEIVRESVAADRKLREESQERVYKLCGDRDITVKHQMPSDTPLRDIITESRFADLLLVSNTTSFSFLYETNPPRFVKDVLADAQCPVMVLPEQLPRIREVVFSYNGTFSSMHAIRQFTQLFPDLSDIPVQVVYVAEKSTPAIPNEKLLKDYLEHHYDEVRYMVLNGDPVAEFLALLMHRKDCLVTYGAYGRSRVSRFFHRSDAESILRTTNTPVFITHP